MDIQPLKLPDLIAETGLLEPEGRSLILLSGGGDSVALLDAITALKGQSRVIALHVNYGLRGAESDADEAFCKDLCKRLDVPLIAEKFSLDPSATGNLHQQAREARYELAEVIAENEECSEIVVAHTADDQAETILYRLFSSPGRRALLGMKPRNGNVVRPLLGVRRSELRDWCRSRDLEWREDASNEDEKFARTRVRGLLSEAESVHPAAVANILASAESLKEEGEALDAIATGLLIRAVADDGTLQAERLAAAPAALGALMLRAYVEERIGMPVPAAGRALSEVLRLSTAGGSHELQLEGAALLIEYGSIRVISGEAGDPPDAVELAVPGSVEFGAWLIAAGETFEDAVETTKVDQELAAGGLTVRSREPGDRISPSGMDGSKSLQDLFVDRKVPQRLRDQYPVVCAGTEVIWVPGLARVDQPDAGVLLSAKLNVDPTHLHS